PGRHDDCHGRRIRFVPSETPCGSARRFSDRRSRSQFRIEKERMTSTHELSFAFTRWSLAISLVLLAATAGLSIVAWRRSENRGAVGLLELSRLALMLLAALVLNQPEWVEQFRTEEKPTIAVLYDDSASMTTRDVVRAGQSSQPISRKEAIAP